jgi:hypothetical protein
MKEMQSPLRLNELLGRPFDTSIQSAKLLSNILELALADHLSNKPLVYKKADQGKESNGNRT